MKGDQQVKRGLWPPDRDGNWEIVLRREGDVSLQGMLGIGSIAGSQIGWARLG